MVQKRANNGGKKVEVKAYKILEWKDEVDKSYISWVIIKLM